MKKIKVASVQFNHKPGNKNFNLQRILSFVQQAAENAVELIAFPEMCITGYWHIRNLSQKEVESLSEPGTAGSEHGVRIYTIS
jgi:N-carbamoylputrescine amidase